QRFAAIEIRALSIAAVADPASLGRSLAKAEKASISPLLVRKKPESAFTSENVPVFAKMRPSSAEPRNLRDKVPSTPRTGSVERYAAAQDCFAVHTRKRAIVRGVTRL